MGSSCSAGTEKGRSLSDPGRSKSSHPSTQRKRAFSMTSSSAVNLHMGESGKPEDGESEPAECSNEPSENLKQQAEPTEAMDPDLKAPSVTSNLPTPTRPVRTSQVSMESKPISMDEYPKHVQHLLLGNITQFHDDRPRMIRLYIAACDSDSRVERLAIMRHVVQPLSDLCYSRHFSLELMDPHWLGDGQSTNSQVHLVDLLLNNSDTVPTILLIMLNDKIGSCLPWVLSEDVFRHVASSVADDSERQLIESSFLRDDTIQEAKYQLIVSDCCRGHSGEITETFCPDCNQKLIKVEQLLKKYMTEEDRQVYLKSGLEREITFALEQSGIPADNVFVVRRTFSGVASVSDLYMDVVDEDVDQSAVKTLERLKETVDNNVPISNSFNFDVKWTSDVLDPANVTEHAHYVKGLCDTLKTEISRKVTSIMDSHSPTILPNNIPDRMYQEITAHTALCQQLRDICPSTLTVLDTVSSYVCSSDRRPLVLQGEAGTDTHVITARVATLTLEKEVTTVVRFQGLTPESKGMICVFSGICRQLGQVYNKPTVETNQECFKELIKNANDQRPLLIVLGEVTQSLGTWIPLELPPHVKVIVLTSENHVVEELSSQLHDECFLKLPSFSNETKSKMLLGVNKLFAKEDPILSAVIHDLSYTVVASLRREFLCDLSSSSVISTDEQSKTHAFNKLCDSLDANFSQIFVSKVFSLLLLARSGLSSFHIISFLSQDEEILKVLKLTDPLHVIHTLLLLWSKMKIVLQPFLFVFSYNGNLLHVVFNSTLRRLLSHRYLPSDVKLTHYRICAYCESLCHAMAGEQNKHLFYLNSFEMFKYLEYPYHYKKCNKGHFNEEFVFNLDWLRRKIRATSTMCALEDIVMDEDPEVQLLSKILAMSADALDLSSSQITSQIVCRLNQGDGFSKYVNIDKMLTECKSQDDPYFVTTTSCLKSPNSEAVQTTTDVLCGLFLAPNHTQCVIGLSQERGEIVVWDVKSQEAIRTLQGVDHPHDLKMVDSYRAVVLCNRELKIYNLNEGRLETSLRGVLNLRTPMFGVKNEESVITVSRNRMYINVLDIASGDTAATFKAGEDRFLNSLLVSKNGKMLVCGDETQKPSPLLVWELEESRLLHDLRMAQHEFITSISDITDDGHYVVCACQELDSSSPNFLVVYDLISGQVFKIWKWEHNVTCVAVDTSSKGVVSGLDTGDIIVWDLVSGNARFHIQGVNSVCNRVVLTSHSDLCLTWYKGESTLAETRTVCVWDIKKGLQVACMTLDSRPSCCTISPRGDTLTLGLPGHDGIVTFTLKVKEADQFDDAEASYGDPANMGVVFQV